VTRRLPPLGALRAFEAAARYESFAKAADELAVTPAAVSQQIRQLEADLGVTLFRRLPRGLVLTQAGRSALPELGHAFAHLSRAVEGLRGGSLVGPLTVSVIPSFAGRWLVPRLGRFVAAYPEIEITVRSELRNVDFAREDVDVGIRYGKGIYPGLDTRPLLTEQVFPVCAPSLLAGERPLRKLDDLRHHTLLHDRQLSSDEPSLYWRTWLRDFGVEGWDQDRGPGFTEAMTMLTACERGLGVALGRGGLCAEELANGRLVRPFQEGRAADYAYFAVVPTGHGEAPRVRMFLAWLEEEAARTRLVTEAR
jgi:LysR family glycine cleavage system transcriptional activator